MSVAISSTVVRGASPSTLSSRAVFTVPLSDHVQSSFCGAGQQLADLHILPIAISVGVLSSRKARSAFPPHSMLSLHTLGLGTPAYFGLKLYLSGLLMRSCLRSGPVRYLRK